MTSILLNADMQVLIEQYGEEAVKDALIQALEKDMDPACPAE